MSRAQCVRGAVVFRSTDGARRGGAVLHVNSVRTGLGVLQARVEHRGERAAAPSAPNATAATQVTLGTVDAWSPCRRAQIVNIVRFPIASGPAEPKLARFSRERRLVPEVGIEPTRGVNPT